MTGDPADGPLIGIVTTGDQALVKEGSLSAPWNDEHSGIVEVSVASDTSNGPLITATTDNGEVTAKEGSLTAAWHDEWPDNAAYVVAASDSGGGPLIGVVTEGTVTNPYDNEAMVKEGSLGAGWTLQNTEVAPGAFDVSG